jgi:hypothetical protein
VRTVSNRVARFFEEWRAWKTPPVTLDTRVDPGEQRSEWLCDKEFPGSRRNSKSGRVTRAFERNTQHRLSGLQWPRNKLVSRRLTPANRRLSVPRARPGNRRVQARAEAGHLLDAVADNDQRRTAPDEAVMAGPAREMHSHVTRQNRHNPGPLRLFRLTRDA